MINTTYLKLKGKTLTTLVFAFLSCITPCLAQNPYDCPGCNLSGKSFIGQNLSDANFSGAILDNANFTGCNLSGAMLSNASAKNANFTNADLDPSDYGPANFSDANLDGANFTGASMNGVVLEYASQNGTNFTGAILSNALPGLYIKLSSFDAKNLPIYKGAKLSCEFKRFASQLDLSMAVFADCKNWDAANAAFKSRIISSNKPKDMQQPIMYQFSSVADDTTLSKRKLKLPVEMANAFTTSGDTIYVSTSGTDNASCGARNSPCKTLGQAVTNANPNGYILVDYGEYAFASTITINKNLNLIGGFNNGQPTQYQSLLASPGKGQPVFNINGSGIKVGLSQFIVNGSQPTDNNMASVALMASNGAVVQMKGVNINAFGGSSGSTGAAVAVGASGNNGSAGSSGTGGGGGTSPCGGNSGGIGANKSTNSGSSDCKCLDICFRCEVSISYYAGGGGYGGAGTTGYYAPGSSPATAVNYMCPSKERPQTAGTGTKGNAANCGAAGSASSNTTGSFNQNGWQASVGGNGTAGGNGGGGGGGGAGGPCHYCNCFCGGHGDFYEGTAGGGGGAGGCGAAGGNGGSQGGASFGLVLQYATGIVDNTVKITGGAGGNGGAGGSGNLGGAGGTGGSAQKANDVCNDTGGQGGDGGAGGAGGASGGGAGGNGGPSACIALVGTASVTGNPVYYTGIGGSFGSGGSGGSQVSGGSCSGPKGDDGKTGSAGNTLQY